MEHYGDLVETERGKITRCYARRSLRADELILMFQRDGCGPQEWLITHKEANLVIEVLQKILSDD